MAVGRNALRVLDEYLVAAARTGDREAFAALAGRWHGKLVAHAWRLTGDQEMARDAAQAAWVEIVRGLSRLQDERAFPAWAYRIVSRGCAKQIGAAVRRRDLAAGLAAMPEPDPAEPGERLTTSLLRAEIGRLPAEQRSALALFYLDEMSVAEVAVALDVPLGTVKTRLLHARRKLREAMEGEDNA
jgi:RNA polymerase sigma factor (sigma-70 family)